MSLLPIRFPGIIELNLTNIPRGGDGDGGAAVKFLSRFSRRGLQGAKTTVGLWVMLHNGLRWLKEITKTENSPKKHPPLIFKEKNSRTLSYEVK